MVVTLRPSSCLCPHKPLYFVFPITKYAPNSTAQPVSLPPSHEIFCLYTAAILTGGLRGEGLLLISKCCMKILRLFHNQNITGLPDFLFFLLVELRNQCLFVKYFQGEILQAVAGRVFFQQHLHQYCFKGLAHFDTLQVTNTVSGHSGITVSAAPSVHC